MNWMREPDAEPIPGYTLIAPLGTGGFGEVWKCVAPGGIHKAIKFVFGNLESLDTDSEKALQEFKAIERMKEVRHPFVLSIEQIRNEGGELVIVMELADKSLHDCLLEHQTTGRPGVPRDVLLGYMADAAEGLDHLIERHALLHLDVKPKNLFLIGDRVKVADFGLVKHLERQSSAGLMGGLSPVYAAPETFANKINKHSDQYSLAVVYYELLTGGRPFAGKNIRQLALQHMTETPDLRSLPEADRPVMAKALAKEPDARFPSCSAFIRALMTGPVPPAPGGRTVADLTLPRFRTTADLDLNQHTPPTTPSPFGLRDEVPASAPTPPPRPAADAFPSATISRLEVGVLRPAVLIGVGSFGRRAVQQIRCRLLDRVGDLTQVPSFRFIYLDADPDAPAKAAAASSEVALQAEHVVHVPLQPVTAYRRKQLDQILEWLPRDKLYSIPRSLAVEGSRALGRLAFCDHYLKFVTRLKHDLTVATHPEAIKQSADQTGLAPRAKQPSVYVFASATGGTGGMLLDLGHAVRRTLAKLHMTDAPVTAFVFCGAPDDPASPPAELANIFATLTELNHYADPDVPFAAQYGGSDGPKLEARGLPFSAAYLLPMAQRSTEGFRDCVSHLSGYIAQELTTPLGVGLEEFRRRPPAAGRTPFRGFGTFGVWFPRGLLLRSAARQVCTAVLRRWAETTTQTPPEATALVQHIFHDPRLTPEAVQQFVVRESVRGPDGSPLDAVRSWFATASDQVDVAARRGEGANWSTAVWDHAKDLLGMEPTTDADSPYRRGRLSRALDHGLSAAVAAWENELNELIRPLLEMDGPRLAAAEAVLRAVADGMRQAGQAQEQQLIPLANQRAGAVAAAQAGLDGCQGQATYSLFGGRTARPLRAFADRVKAFADVRVSEDLAAAAAQFYLRVGDRLTARARDIGFAREQILKLTDGLDAPPPAGQNSGRFAAPGSAESPDEAMQTTLQMSNTVRVVLPNGDDQLDRSAVELLRDLTPADYQRLHAALERLVVEPRGGLLRIVRGTPDLRRGLAVPLIEQATAFLADRIPVRDVTDVELSGPDAAAGGLAKRIAGYLRLAAPQAPGPEAEEKTYVLVPATDAGLRYARVAKTVAPKAVTVMVQGSNTDLMFCREQGHLRAVDLMKLIEPCWEAYQERLDEPEANPHCRFDVHEWMPLAAR